mgnify:FL=1
MTLQKITGIFSSLPRLQKQILIAITDSLLLLLALWFAFSLRLGVLYIPVNEKIILLFAAIPFISIPIFMQFGLYRAIIRYLGLRALWAVIQAVSLYAMLWGLLILFARIDEVPRSVILINWLVAILFIGGTRMLARWWFAKELLDKSEKKSRQTRVAIYGAGSARIQLATAVSYSHEYKPVAFIDDKPELHNNHVNSLRVYPFDKLDDLIKKFSVQEVLLAMPSATRSRRNEIIRALEKYQVHVRTLPGMADIAGGQIKIEDIKEVEIEDLLGRDPVVPYHDLLDANIRDKAVLVTGAGGSIGSELCKQIIKLQPKCLVIFEQSEFALYNVNAELELLNKEQGNEFKLQPVLGSVLDQERVEKVCQSFSIDTIYHAAAYKHVPLTEKNPLEVIRNNVIGTLMVADAAMNANVETYVLISTDKAVRPTNVMGASKRFAEMVLQALSQQHNTTRFCMVRFGNVLGSSGSVVPLFRKQIEKGGPVTVTHPDIIRYFMTIPEAAQLVIQAGAMGVGGDVFLLDMGEPVKISELAKKMIRLSGLEVCDDENPNGDIRIEYTGLRPGEKLYEELLIGNNPIGTRHPRIFRATEEFIPWEELLNFLDLLQNGLEQGDVESVLTLLLQVVKDYQPQGNIEDLVWKESRKGSGKDTVVQLKDFRDKSSGSETGSAS